MPLDESDRYLAPHTLDEAAQCAATQDAAILAGGTDLLPRWSKGLLQRPEALVSLRNVEGLEGVARENGEIRIGACTTISEVASNPIVRDAAPVLAGAAGRIACPQVRNRATIGGNLCNASPAADTAVPLILLDAVLDVASWSGSSVTTREVPITEFFNGPGATILEPGEILTGIRIMPLFHHCGTDTCDTDICDTGVSPVSDHGRDARATRGFGMGSRQRPSAEMPRGLKPAARQEEGPRGLKSAARPAVYAAWDKLGTRPAMEIAVASVGIAIKIEGETVTHARVGYGSVAPVPVRGRKAEAALMDHPLSVETIEWCQAAARAEIAPISDVRASAAYRREVVGVMLRRMLERAARE